MGVHYRLPAAVSIMISGMDVSVNVNRLQYGDHGAIATRESSVDNLNSRKKYRMMLL